MAKITTEFEFELSQPLSFHKGGEVTKTNKLLLKAPSNAHRFHLNKLKQGFMKACMGMQSYNKSTSHQVNADDQEGKIDGKMVLMMLLASDMDFSEYLDYFKNFICSQPSVCLVEGNIPLNGLMFDQLSEEDYEDLLGKYIENFLLFSWMRLLQGIK